MANQNKRKHTLAQRMAVYKKRFNRLDKTTKLQLIAIAALIVLIIIVAVSALVKVGKDPESIPPLISYEDGIGTDDSYDAQADKSYQKDAYTQQIKEYSQVVLPQNSQTDPAYFRETLFIGDSNTDGLSAYGHLALQQVIGVASMGIQSVQDKACVWFVGNEQPVTIPTAVSMLKPRRIIINFGTNNTVGMDADTFVRTYKASLKAIEKAYKYADIVVASVLPVAKQRSNIYVTMQTIDEFNLALAKMCQEEGYKFLNTAEIFKDPKTGFMKKEYVSPDGIHLNSDGYKAYLEYVGNHKYITPDNRPARGTIPTRRNAPYVDESASSISSMLSSSMASSSSMIISSSKPHSSSHMISSSKPHSSSNVVSSSKPQSSSQGGSSGNAASSSKPQSSSQADSSESSSESTSSTLPSTPTPTSPPTTPPTEPSIEPSAPPQASSTPDALPTEAPPTPEVSPENQTSSETAE